MYMKRIKEVIVVEGKNDTNTLQAFFECDTIETSGDQVSQATIERIRIAQEKRGVIIFTDPDRPGEHIRRLINDAIPGCKNAFIDKEKAKTPKKVGVEHASKEDLWQALCQNVTFNEDQESLSWQDYIELGCIGNTKRRYLLCDIVHIGPCNAKTCYKRLNQMGYTQAELLRLLEEYEHGTNS